MAEQKKQIATQSLPIKRSNKETKKKRNTTTENKLARS